MNFKHYTLLLLLAFCSSIVSAQNTLNIPATLEGETIALEIAADSVQFLDGTITQTYGFNGPYLGPTLILHEGDSVHFQVTNNLEEATTVHWHGMHVPAYADGGPHTPILPGETWEPSIKVLDEAATSWYHPHLHGNSTQHTILGLAGMILVRDESDIQAQLPRTYGVDEFPLVMAYQGFDDDNQITRGMGVDVTPLINGTFDPVIDLPAQMVRFHLLNGDEEFNFNLSLSNGDDIIVIATEGGLLESPAYLQELKMYNGERYEILVDLSAYEGQTLYLENYFIDGSETSEHENFLTINVVEATSDAVTSVPTELTTHEIWDEAEADVTREKAFTGSGPNWTINDTEFSMMVIDDTVYLDDIEIWVITNETNTDHPFHIHDEQFFILDVNSEAPADYMSGPKDVVNVEPDDVVRFITKFEDFADSDIPYMYHCHILPHEDSGMMGQFIVIDGTTSITEVDQEGTFTAYPNPADDNLWIEFEDLANVTNHSINIMNVMGQTIHTEQVANTATNIDVQDWAAGMYFVNLTDENGVVRAVRKVVVQQ